jgi:BirA family biotin operon repressor/biotin-[acetyl-CoA-carboxylase] ligase
VDYYSSLKKLLSDDLDCHFFDSIDSTNLFLSNRPYSKKTQICVTRQQSDGRGQYGRKWVSQKDGSILFSIRQNFIQEENLSGLSLIIGLAIIKVLENEYSYQGFKIKWPNDIYFKDSKLAGILLENQIQSGIQSVVIGVGLNYNLGKNFNCYTPWIDLSQMQQKIPDIQQLIAKLINNILLRIDNFKNHGLMDLELEWDQYDMLHGRKLRISQSDEILEGTVTGINDKGGLKVLTKNGVQELYSSKHIEFI